MTNVPPNLLAHIAAELEGLSYGSVTIEVVNGKTVDVITQRRTRFHTTEQESDGRARLLKVEKYFHEG